MPAYSRVTASPFSPNPKYHESPYLINGLPHFAAADEREWLPSAPFPIFPIRMKSLLSCATECTPNALEHLALLPLRVSERRFSFASHSELRFSTCLGYIDKYHLSRERLPTLLCTNAICTADKRHLYRAQMPTYPSQPYDLERL